jgi:hypothetical protein
VRSALAPISRPPVASASSKSRKLMPAWPMASPATGP